MTPQEFGDHLRRYLDSYSRAKLAKKLFQDGRFAPQGIGSAGDLERLIVSTEGGGDWQYSRREFTAFLEILVACGPARSTTEQLILKLAGGEYSQTL